MCTEQRTQVKSAFARLSVFEFARLIRSCHRRIIGWYCSEPRLSFNRTVVLRYRYSLKSVVTADGAFNLLQTILLTPPNVPFGPRVKALYRSWGISCGGPQVYAPRHRSEWLNKIGEFGVRRRAEFLYQQLDAVRALRQAVRRDLLAESRKQSASRLLRQIPYIGPIRAALLVALIQTPHRLRTKRQLWTYSGLAIDTRDSAQYRYVAGQLQRAKKPQQLRGLNQNHNHDMKAICKSAATMASNREGPFHDFYQGLLTKGMKPAMARLTWARKIAAITLVLWKIRSTVRR